MAVWCRDDCIKEVNKQLEDKTVYKDINLKKRFFQIWSIKAIEFLRVFTHANILLGRNSTTFNLGKLYILTKIQNNSK